MLNSMMRGSMIVVGLLKFGPDRRVMSSTVLRFNTLNALARTETLYPAPRLKRFSTRRSSWLLCGSWRAS
jgi:hypothetical protein